VQWEFFFNGHSFQLTKNRKNYWKSLGKATALCCSTKTVYICRLIAFDNTQLSRHFEPFWHGTFTGFWFIPKQTYVRWLNLCEFHVQPDRLIDVLAGTASAPRDVCSPPPSTVFWLLVSHLSGLTWAIDGASRQAPNCPIYQPIGRQQQPGPSAVASLALKGNEIHRNAGLP
jgi:hypothetical protein